MPTILSKALSASAFAASSLFVNSANASSDNLSSSSSSLLQGRTTAVTQYGDEAPILSVPLKRVVDHRGGVVSPSLRSRFTKLDVMGVYGAAYLAEITIGNSPEPQTVDLLLDTGSFEMWVNPVCSRSAIPEFCEDFGHYDPVKSSSAKKLQMANGQQQGKGGQFSVQYGLGTTVGDYYTDDVFISGTRIRDQRFGVANDSESLWFGIMGLGHGIMSGYSNYPLIVESVVAQHHSSSKLFSLDLGSQRETPGSFVSGQLIFGGVDANKFSGKLAKVPTDQSDPHYKVMLHSLSIHQPGSGSHSKPIQSGPKSKKPLPVVVDSGTTVSLLPKRVVEELASQFPGATSDKSGGYTVDCKYQKEDGHVEFAFESTTIRVGYNDFIWKSRRGRCSLGVAHNPNIPVNILGDSFLRGAYVVYDQDNKALYMANYESCSAESALVAIPAGVDAAAQVQGNCEGKETDLEDNSSSSSQPSTSKLLEMRGDYTVATITPTASEMQKMTHTSIMTSISSTPVAVFVDACPEDADSDCVPGVESISMKTFTETSTTIWSDDEEEKEEAKSPMTASETNVSSAVSSTGVTPPMVATTTSSSSMINAGSSPDVKSSEKVEEATKVSSTGTKTTAELVAPSAEMTLATATAGGMQPDDGQSVKTTGLAMPTQQQQEEEEDVNLEEHQAAGHLPPIADSPVLATTATAPLTATAKTMMMTTTATATIVSSASELKEEDCETQSHISAPALQMTSASSPSPFSSSYSFTKFPVSPPPVTPTLPPATPPSSYSFTRFPVSPPPVTPTLPPATPPAFVPPPMAISASSPSSYFPYNNKSSNASASYILGSSGMMMKSSSSRLPSSLTPTPTPTPISGFFTPSSSPPSRTTSPSIIPSQIFGSSSSALQNPTPTEIKDYSSPPPLPYVPASAPYPPQQSGGGPYSIPGFGGISYFNSTHTHGTAIPPPVPIAGGTAAPSWVTKPTSAPLTMPSSTSTSSASASNTTPTNISGGAAVPGNGTTTTGAGMSLMIMGRSGHGDAGLLGVVVWVGVVILGGAGFVGVW